MKLKSVEKLDSLGSSFSDWERGGAYTCMCTLPERCAYPVNSAHDVLLACQCVGACVYVCACAKCMRVYVSVTKGGLKACVCLHVCVTTLRLIVRLSVQCVRIAISDF